MNLEVVGRHALFFDDDASATFVNSGDALVDWNSLLIDRYDVRHLLSAPPQPRKRRTHSSPDGLSADAEIDRERYLDLQAAIEKEEAEADAKSAETNGFHSVAFSYGNPVDSNDQKNEMGDSSFRPPFHVPENLLHCLPPTEKVHQIIARTALFVAKNGGQSEIVLRVKQGDNPTFGFLMPDHHLHPYFRYLIDNQELLKSNSVDKSENEKKETSAALSLLGSVYGTGDDDDVATDNLSESKENESKNTVSSVGHNFQKTKTFSEVNEKAEVVPKHLNLHKENTQILNKNSVIKVSKAGIPNSKKKECHLSKPSFSASVKSLKAEPVIIEPPSDMKKLVDKVVEFILKNGSQFEAVLTEQDSRNGRFPFLLNSNPFHPYYKNILRKAQESSGKSSRLDKNLSSEQASGEIPYDYDRKEKFKMVLGKSKNDSDDSSTKNATSASRITIDAAQAAAILRAGTRGLKNSNLGIIPNLSLNGEIKEPNETDSTDDHMTKEQKLKAERLKRAKMFVSMLKSGAAPSKSEAVERESSSVSLDVKNSVKEDESEKKLSSNEIHERMSKRKYRSKSSRYEDDETKDENDNGEKENNERRSLKKNRSHTIVEDEEDMDYRDSKRKHRSYRSSRENDTKEEEDDEEDRAAYKKKHRSHRSSPKNSTNEEEDEEVWDYKHGKRKHRSHREKSKELDHDDEEEDKDKEYRDDKRKLKTRYSSRENGTEEEEDDGDDVDERDYRQGKRKHRSHREKSKELDYDDEDKEYRDDKRKLKTRYSSRENGTEEEEYVNDVEERDYRHGKRKRRSHREKSRELDDDEEDKEYRDEKRKLKTRYPSCENGTEEEEYDDDVDERDYKHGKRKHRSRRSSHENGKEIEEDEEDRNYRRSKKKRREEDDDVDRDHDRKDRKKGSKKHRYLHSSEEDEIQESDYNEKSKEKHKSRRSSRHRRNKHKSENSESLNLKKHEKSSSDQGRPDLEEGEITSKNSDQTRGNVGAGGASREASIDVSKSCGENREATEVPDDLRAKIRAMLMKNL